MTEKAKVVNLPWVEKYRPATLNDLISHQEIIQTSEFALFPLFSFCWVFSKNKWKNLKIPVGRFISEGQLPHLLFYGPPGTGKTSTILAIARQLYKNPKEMHQMVLELNASDDRGIGIVRGPILDFASTRTIFNCGFKLIILDEADAMTNDAQNALRRSELVFLFKIRVFGSALGFFFKKNQLVWNVWMVSISLESPDVLNINERERVDPL